MSDVPKLCHVSYSALVTVCGASASLCVSCVLQYESLVAACVRLILGELQRTRPSVPLGRAHLGGGVGGIPQYKQGNYSLLRPLEVARHRLELGIRNRETRRLIMEGSQGHRRAVEEEVWVWRVDGGKV